MDDQLAALLPGWIEPTTAKVLVERTGADADRLAEVVREAWTTGALRCEDGMWWLPFEVPHIAGDPRAATSSVTGIMRELCARGRPDEALQVGFEAAAALVPGSSGAPEIEARLGAIGIASLFALLDAGRVHAVIPAAESMHRESITRGAPAAQAWFAAARGGAYLAAGRILDARRALTEARIVARQIGDIELSSLVRDGVSLTYTLLGEGEPTFVEPSLPSITIAPHDESSITRGHAWSDASKANLAALATAADAERRAGRHGVAASLAADLALLGDPVTAKALLREIGPLEGDILPLWLPIAEALAEGDAWSLLACADRLEELGMVGLSAAFSLRAIALCIEADEDDSVVRDLLATANRRARLVQLGDQYLAQFRRLLPLREREHEIAQLAADGLTNKQIAERLVISLRTVENHLYRVYDKLGIDGRDDLRRLLSTSA